MRGIRVSFDTDAPSERNIPVHVEVFNEQMVPVSTEVLPLDYGGTIAVTGAGRYLVTATLPTGESIRTSVEVKADADGSTSAVLTLGESSPSEELSWAFTRQRLPRAFGAARNFMSPGFVSSGSVRPLGVRTLRFVEGRWRLDESNALTLWSTDVREADNRLLGRLAIPRAFGSPIPPSAMEPLGTQWYPLFVHYKVPSADGTTLSGLVAVPHGPAIAEEELVASEILFVRADGALMTGAPTRTLVRGARTSAEALLSYLENGVFSAVRQVGTEVISEAVRHLEGKQDDPFGAAIAGYVLLRTGVGLKGVLNQRAWMKNLADWFPQIPDGAVIYAASLMRGEDGQQSSRIEEARDYLLKAVNRGIPTYTIGMRMVFDTLRSLVAARTDDEELGEAFARVCSAAAYTDWSAQTTTLTFSNDARLEGILQSVYIDPTEPSEALDPLRFHAASQTDANEARNMRRSAVEGSPIPEMLAGGEAAGA